MVADFLNWYNKSQQLLAHIVLHVYDHLLLMSFYVFSPIQSSYGICYDRNPLSPETTQILGGKINRAPLGVVNWVCPGGIPSVPPPSYGVYHASASRSVHINTVHG